MSSNEPAKPNHLEPSPLGTKEYWDNLYTTEITNHTQDKSDVGTIWFSGSSAEDKILPFLDEKIVGEKILGAEVGANNCSFLDLGTGNGHFLLRLRGVSEEDEDDDEEDGRQTWRGRMLGVDYSEKSIEFARRIVGDKKAEMESEVEFLWWDIMTQDPFAAGVLSGEQGNGWDVVHDKGTFDAISLSEEQDENGRRVCEQYKEKVVPLVREGGLLLLTSCNWTAEELKAWFEGGGLRTVGEIGYRSFSFGGKKGQTISSVCFMKQSSS
ncbi:Protein-lysine N-methyltransferase EFM4 [Venustampulla echinocandica]|uniref:Protein-lysine N-methyltransferase EFM4 n=1 Tax=Venustampulla echinocandica TaxID=2656787 RepID=A0A370TYY9_9HELO|nr:Protein-lysine N-methyltransferase EFM4 [Venustampulla echinocandica]RDL40743.1 Protein-lysine N-methyltransferase EFM4 [Venustampulla echinocandica]